MDAGMGEWVGGARHVPLLLDFWKKAELKIRRKY
jgi:hypothetical protein